MGRGVEGFWRSPKLLFNIGLASKSRLDTYDDDEC